MARVGITTHTGRFDQLTEGEQVYVDVVTGCGMEPVLLVNTADFTTVATQLDELDGLILIGGGDVHPCHYGRVIEEGIEYMNFDRDRDLCELQLARHAHHLNMPTLGICRGNQVMNVSLGGTLVADIETDKGGMNHMQEKPYHIHEQTVHIQPETRLFDILFGSQARHIKDIDWVINTNSIHHQAIEHPAFGLTINAITDDGVFEGIEDQAKRFFIGVQWHPEYLKNCLPLFEEFRRACERG